jgi:hypothetical protein
MLWGSLLTAGYFRLLLPFWIDWKISVRKSEYQPFVTVLSTVCTYITTPSKVQLGELVVPQLVKKFPTSMKHEGLLPCSHETTTGPCPGPDESSRGAYTSFFKVHCNIILHSDLFTSSFLTISLDTPLIPPMYATSPAHFQLDHINRTGQLDKLRCSSLCNFLLNHVTFSQLGQNIFLRSLFLSTLS